MIAALIGFVGFAADIGYYYYTKFKLQSTADAVVLVAIRDIENRVAAGDRIITENDFNPAELEKKEIVLGEWDAATKTFTATNDPAPDKIAMRVLLQRQIPAFFSRIPPFNIQFFHPQGRATAALVQEGVVVSLGPTLLEVNTEKSALLNGLLGGLLGTTINLDAVGWQGIAAAKIDLVKFLDLAKVRLNIGTTEALLENGEVSLLDIVDLSLDALKAEDTTARVNLELLRTQILGADIDPLNLRIKLGELINIETNQKALARAETNLLDLIRVAAEVFNFKSGLTTEANIGLNGALDVNLRAKVIEPPVIKIMKEGDTIHSAAVRLYLHASILSALNGNSGLLNLPLYLELGAGDAKVERITPEFVEMTATSTTSALYLGKITDSLFFSDSSLTETDVQKDNILNILSLVTVTAKTKIDKPGGTDVLTFTPPFPETQSVNALLGNSVTGITGDLSNPDNFEAELGLLGLPLDLGSTVNQVVGLLNNLIFDPLLTPLLNGVSTILGVYPGRTDLTVLDYAYSVKLVD